MLIRALRREVLRVLWAEYLCGNLADGGELGVLVRRVSRHAARYTARVAATATEWALFSAASPNQVIKINAYNV